MTVTYKSPAKKVRSIQRVLEYKKAKLEDMWDTEIIIDKNRNLLWNISPSLKLTLNENVKILDNWDFLNPEFALLSLSVKMIQFQNMWVPDQNSATFFSSIHQHLRRNSSHCDPFCTAFTSPYCGKLVHFLATNIWPD